MSSTLSHPLFHPRTLRKAVERFVFPYDLEALHAEMGKWIRAIGDGSLAKMGEVSVHGDFLSSVFGKVLGYRSYIDKTDEGWELHPELNISGGGGFADAALGYFKAARTERGKVSLEGRVVAPVELKKLKQDLDRATARASETPVEQGWRYALHTEDCKWIVVSNYQEVRLYHINKTPNRRERFMVEELADLEVFKRFYFLFCRQNMLPPQRAGAVSVIDELLVASEDAQEEVTNRLYGEYKETRLALIEHFWTTGGPRDVGDKLRLIEKAQKALDRVLFIAFCEDRGLLPPSTLKKAHDHRDTYAPRPIWNNYKAVFRWIDEGNADPKITAYNGGLFRLDPLLDTKLQVTDELCSELNKLTRYDFEDEVPVEILGHIFEQSITDLEEIRAHAEGKPFDLSKGKRKKQGVYYTPAYITQYIVEESLGRYLRGRFEEINEALGVETIPKHHTKVLREAQTSLWRQYRDVLRNTRVVDPACGSGAFLVAAFDFLMHEYRRVNEALESLTGGQRDIEDLNKTILNTNLYGVDLSEESVEITKLSLWLKTAENNRPLTDLDSNILVGDAIVEDGDFTDMAFDWRKAFPKVFRTGGFDVVLGNPPYVRQEHIIPIKPYLESRYSAYHSTADLYVYFYERGMDILRPGGLMSYIVTNKWLRSGYGKPLRRFFRDQAEVEQLIDFGHAPIFKDVDTFPCIIVCRKPLDGSEGPDEVQTRVYSVPREELAKINISRSVGQYGFDVPSRRFDEAAWSLEPPAVDALVARIQGLGVPLKTYVGEIPKYGLKTGFNAAFIINEATRNRLIAQDSKANDIIKPFLRGRNVWRWAPKWGGEYIILLKSSANHHWPWSHDPDNAESIFKSTYPSVYSRMKTLESRLIKRQDKGVYWWELRSCDYYDRFEGTKLVYQEIQFHPWYGLDTDGFFYNNKAFIIPADDLYLLAVLNSPLMWWFNWRYLPHMKDDALSPKGDLMSNLPIAIPSDDQRQQVTQEVEKSIELTRANQKDSSDMLYWLGSEWGVEKAGRNLEAFWTLTDKQFTAEVKKRGSARRLGPSELRELRETFGEFSTRIAGRNAQLTHLEDEIAAIVYQAYGLSSEDIELVWNTAPLRMPGRRPVT